MEHLNNPRAVAIHEAGHIVIACILGLQIGQVTIVVDEESAGHGIIADPMETYSAWDIRSKREFDAGRAPKLRNFSSAYVGTIIARMAGAEAEDVIIGHCEGGDGQDRREIERIFLTGETEIPRGRWEVVEARMRRQTRRIIRRHQSKIERVANALLARKTLQPNEVEEIIMGLSECRASRVPGQHQASGRC